VTRTLAYRTINNSNKNFYCKCLLEGLRNTQHNETQHNDTQHNDTQHNDTQHNDTHHNDTQQNDTQQNDTQSDILKILHSLSIMTLNVECRYFSVFHVHSYADCRYTKCQYAE
jgi:hypothetical protein